MKLFTKASTPGLSKIGINNFPKKNLEINTHFSGELIEGNLVVISSDIILQRHLIEYGTKWKFSIIFFIIASN